MVSILALDTAQIKAPTLPLTVKFDIGEPLPEVVAKLNRHIEYEIHIPLKNGGKQNWHYFANGHPIGKIVLDNNPQAKQQYCVSPFGSDAKKVYRFSTFTKADEFLKDTCK